MADDLIHHSHLRMRVTGSGNLDVRMLGLYSTPTPVSPTIPTQILVPLPMQSETPRFAQFHVNFEQQYAQIEISTNVIDEFFYITRIVTYIKPVAVAFPM